MSLPSFGDLYERFSDLVEDGYYSGRVLFKTKTTSEGTGVTWKAKIDDEGIPGQDVLGKIAFGFSGAVPDVMECDVKTSIRTDGRVRSKVSVGDMTVFPDTSLELSAEVNTTAPAAEDNIEVTLQHVGPFYTATGCVKFPGDSAGEREVSASGVVGLNGVMAGCNVVVGGDHEYAVAYHPVEADWSLTALCSYSGDQSFTEAKVAYVHEVSEGLIVGAEYRREDTATTNVTLGIERNDEETGLTIKARADSAGTLAAIVRQRVAPGLFLGVSVLREDRTARPKVALSLLFERV